MSAPSWLSVEWYARGYYDGRALGEEATLDAAPTSEARAAYCRGYDAGVAAYCIEELDEAAP